MKFICEYLRSTIKAFIILAERPIVAEWCSPNILSLDRWVIKEKDVLMMEEMTNLRRDHNKYCNTWLPFIILIEKINVIGKETPSLFSLYQVKPAVKILGHFCLYLHLHASSSDMNSHSYIIFLIRSLSSHHSSHHNSVMRYSF